MNLRIATPQPTPAQSAARARVLCATRGSLATGLVGLMTLAIGCSNESATDSASAGDNIQSATPSMNIDDAGAAGEGTHEMMTGADGFFAMSVDSITGEPVDLGQYKGKVVVVVNTASKCGFTPQYAGLQALHEEMKDSGVVVLGFPSNDFMNQEPGSNEEILEFCEANYGVTFPMFSKVKVKPGEGQAPVYTFLQEKTGETPGWNFCKYVVSADGQRVHFFGSRTKPDSEDLRNAINEELAAAGAGAAASG